MFHRILWAIDPAAENAALQRKVVTALTALTSHGNATVEPVHVLSPEEMLFPLGRDAAEERRLLARIEGWLERANVSGVLSPRFLDCGFPGVRARVETLLSYAHETGCDLVAASTHARKGLDRLFLGSFVETLLFHSRIPVLTVNPNTRATQKIHKIIFPSDFDPGARPLFEQMIEAAPHWKARIAVLHKAVGEEQRASALARGEKWVALARAYHVPAEAFIDDTPGSVENSILSFASSAKGGLIAMVTRRGPVGAAIQGSVTKTIVRSAICPVLALHVDSRKRSRASARTGSG